MKLNSNVVVSLTVLGFLCFYSGCCAAVHANQESHGLSEILDFLPNQHDFKFFERCLNYEIKAMTRRDTVKCNKLLETMQRMSESSSKNRKKRNAEILMEQMYHIKIAKMKNRLSEERDEMMSMVAPCSKFSSSVRRNWKKFFGPRAGSTPTEVTTFIPFQQNLSRHEIEVTFGPPALNTSVFREHQLVAVDLAILRTPPCQIDELFGSYSLTVDQIIANKSINIHKSKQSICPTLTGYMLVAELDIAKMKTWFYSSDTSLILRVRLHADPLPGLPTVCSNETILQKVLSLSFHLKVGDAHQVFKPISIGQRPLFDDLAEVMQNRRGRRALKPSTLTLDNQDCRLENYPYKINTYNGEYEVLFPETWNIRECVGRCVFPLTNMNSTNHGLAMSEQLTFHPDPPLQVTVNCVPIAYDDVYHVTYGPGRTLQSGYYKDMAAKYCGCE